MAHYILPDAVVSHVSFFSWVLRRETCRPGRGDDTGCSSFDPARQDSLFGGDGKRHTCLAQASVCLVKGKSFHFVTVAEQLTVFSFWIDKAVGHRLTQHQEQTQIDLP